MKGEKRRGPSRHEKPGKRMRMWKFPFVKNWGEQEECKERSGFLYDRSVAPGVDKMKQLSLNPLRGTEQVCWC